MQYEEALKKIIDNYGIKSQIVVAIEELSELTKELSKNYRGEDNKSNIVEEIADVLLMIDQLKIIYNFDSDFIKSIKHYKVSRTLRRINNGKIRSTTYN